MAIFGGLWCLRDRAAFYHGVVEDVYAIGYQQLCTRL
jgi:hypothetical protein